MLFDKAIQVTIGGTLLFRIFLSFILV